jgi:hypothetical protein
LPKATAEFIGPPADNASHVELKESLSAVSDWTRSIRASPHTTKRLMRTI